MMNATQDQPPPPAYAEGSYSPPPSVNTHTVNATTTARAQLELRPDYVKTLPGILKLVEVASSLICIICASAGGDGSSGWGRVLSVWIFISTLFWFFLNLFNLVTKIHPIRILVEWIYYLVLCILFTILIIIGLVTAVTYPTVWAFVFFGLICAVALAADIFLQFKVWRTEGHITTARATTTATTEGDRTTLVTDVQYGQLSQSGEANK